MSVSPQTAKLHVYSQVRKSHWIQQQTPQTLPHPQLLQVAAGLDCTEQTLSYHRHSTSGSTTHINPVITTRVETPTGKLP